MIDFDPLYTPVIARFKKLVQDKLNGKDVDMNEFAVLNGFVQWQAQLFTSNSLDAVAREISRKEL